LYNNVPPANALPMDGGVPDGVVNVPVLFHTMTTLLLLAFVLNARFICEDPIAVALNETGSDAEGLLMIVKLTFEISKKILPTASTFILACVVGKLGNVTN